MSKHEDVTQARIMIRFGADPDLRIWRSNTGRAWQPMTTRGHALLKELVARNPGDFRPVLYGTPGQPDVSGILTTFHDEFDARGAPKPCARAVGIEVKSDTGKPRPEQIAWRDMFVKRGGLYVLARSEDDVGNALEAARAGRL